MRYACLLLLLLISTTSTLAGMDPAYSSKVVIDTVPFYANGQYDAAVPKPNDYLM